MNKLPLKIMLYLMTFFFPVCLDISGDSLFKATDPVTGSIFSDKRARSVGDIITIYISELTNAAQSGKTALKKKSSLASKINSLLFSAATVPSAKTDALYQNLPYIGSRMGMHNGSLPNSNWDSENDFEGNGAQSSSNKLNGTITAMILEVLPNGNFIIEGQRDLVVDNETQTITLSGIVRPEDIGADNSILSRSIANAKITFSGKGPISKYRERGILKKIWDCFSLN